MDILLATSNPHKLIEVKAILEPLGFTVIGLDAFEDTYAEPVEDADTFMGNAELKAKGYAKMTNVRCLADDSGLVVDAIDGRPGIHSARFAGVGETRDERDEANNQLLLTELAGVPDQDRTARFVCAMCLAEPNGTIVAQSEGTFEGVIAREPSGANGFGYDPLFYVPDAGVTSAEMSSEEKHSRSHRGNALRSIAKHLSQ
ncbi:MAG: non-canonical purine NTP pyrophosphatase, RdgB/HAM1 family [Phycisphaerae bacterium]|nr:non-canonical purine NTP pyrophosphatase, RdgB/HAM1 family [Phycisphaerae bacterium]|tara:strand:- start:184 stop:786 length:603 start_codon:yes stop_codon:yes gene_type:complete